MLGHTDGYRAETDVPERALKCKAKILTIFECIPYYSFKYKQRCMFIKKENLHVSKIE